MWAQELSQTTSICEAVASRGPIDAHIVEKGTWDHCINIENGWAFSNFRGPMTDHSEGPSSCNMAAGNLRADFASTNSYVTFRPTVV